MNEKLRAARFHKGWSIEEASGKVGVSTRAYQRWEQEQNVPNFGSRRLLREAFALTDEQLGFGPRASLRGEAPSLLTLTAEEIAALAALLQGGNTMVFFDQSKRQALTTLLQLTGVSLIAPESLVQQDPWQRLLQTVPKPPLTQETLSINEALLQASWDLSNHGLLERAEGVLAQFLPDLIQSSPSQPVAASLAARSLQLQSIFLGHRLRLADKIQVCQHAVALARHAENPSPNVLVTCLTELAVAYRYSHRYQDALQTCQENLSHAAQASPLVRARAYSEAAVAFALSTRAREAEFYLSLASEHFPAHPDADPAFRFADSGPHTLILREGLVHLALGHATLALERLDQIQTHSQSPKRNSVEIDNQRGRAALAVGDLERYALSLQDALVGAVALQSPKRYTEAIEIFRHDLPPTWKTAAALKPIIAQFSLDDPSLLPDVPTS